jgi:hypothetical protein
MSGIITELSPGDILHIKGVLMLRNLGKRKSDFEPDGPSRYEVVEVNPDNLSLRSDLNVTRMYYEDIMHISCNIQGNLGVFHDQLIISPMWITSKFNYTKLKLFFHCFLMVLAASFFYIKTNLVIFPFSAMFFIGAYFGVKVSTARFMLYQEMKALPLKEWRLHWFGKRSIIFAEDELNIGSHTSTNTSANTGTTS